MRKNRAHLLMKSPVSVFVSSSIDPVTAGRQEELSAQPRAGKGIAKTQVPREIEENEERLRLAEAAGQIGTWEWDPKRDTRTMSAELLRIFGIGASDPKARVYGPRGYGPRTGPRYRRLCCRAATPERWSSNTGTCIQTWACAGSIARAASFTIRRECSALCRM